MLLYVLTAKIPKGWCTFSYNMGYFDVQAGIGVSPFFQPHSCFPAVGILQSRWLPCSRSLNCFWYFENSQIVLIETGFLCSGLIIANTSKRNYPRFSHHYLQMEDKQETCCDANFLLAWKATDGIRGISARKKVAFVVLLIFFDILKTVKFFW